MIVASVIISLQVLPMKNCVCLYSTSRLQTRFQMYCQLKDKILTLTLKKHSCEMSSSFPGYLPLNFRIYLPPDVDYFEKYRFLSNSCTITIEEVLAFGLHPVTCFLVFYYCFYLLVPWRLPLGRCR